jgi:hypothetical protein
MELEMLDGINTRKLDRGSVVQCISAVKIKTVLVKSNNFFPIFVHSPHAGCFPTSTGRPKALLNKGFKLLPRSLECLLLLMVEPPFGGRSLHEGIDIPHAHQIPDAL